MVALVAYTHFFLFTQINESATVEEADIAVGEAADSLKILGSFKWLSKLEDKDSLVHAALQFHLNGRMQEAIEQ